MLKHLLKSFTPAKGIKFNNLTISTQEDYPISRFVNAK